MIRMLMSRSAAGLLRALVARAGVPRDRILLTDVRSIDWQSLTMIGERHELELRIPGPGAGEIAERLCADIGEAEFAIPGQVVADVAVVREPGIGKDGSVTLTIEALTIDA